MEDVEEMSVQNNWFVEIGFEEYGAFLKGVFPTSTKNKILKALYSEDKICNIKTLNLKLLSAFEVPKYTADCIFFNEKSKSSGYTVEKISDCAFIVYYDGLPNNNVSVFKELMASKVV